MGKQFYLSDEDQRTLSVALSDAWSWEDSLADANGRQSPEGQRADKWARKIRALQNRLFGTEPVEVQLANKLKNAPMVSLVELMNNPTSRKFGDDDV